MFLVCVFFGLWVFWLVVGTPADKFQVVQQLDSILGENEPDGPLDLNAILFGSKDRRSLSLVHIFFFLLEDVVAFSRSCFLLVFRTTSDNEASSTT